MTPAEPVSVAGSLLPVAASLVAVIGVIFALGWLMRRMPGAVRAGSALRVRGALPVGARERVVWIEAGGQHLLIGVTAQSVRTLHTFDQAPAEPPAAAANDFADRLRQLIQRGPQS